jgi:hypothetical protein
LLAGAPFCKILQQAQWSLQDWIAHLREMNRFLFDFLL